ncbi:MAG: hypothetical protein KGH49_00315 [Candidatus Micrarchaeota archaeon]|nr:hypothetical protein [Candidatus Micrarchaeota archaeon]
MPEINAALALTSDKIKAFTINELELNIAVGTADTEPYWVECVYEVPMPLSLAPDKSLLTAKSLVGIISVEAQKEKRVKIYSRNDVYPSVYTIKATLFVYDKDGAIAERKEYTKELECGETNAQILQNP